MVVEVEQVEPRADVFTGGAELRDEFGEMRERLSVAVGAALEVIRAPRSDFSRVARTRGVGFDPRKDFAVAFAGGEFAEELVGVPKTGSGR